MTASRRWKKSSASGQETDCVELANTLDAARDTKNPSVVLKADVKTLVSMLRDSQIGY
jgi:hypothetical protein